MIRKLRNLVSYVSYVCSLNMGMVVVILIDLAFLAFSIFNFQGMVQTSAGLVAFLIILANLLWQIYRFITNFSFLSNFDPRNKVSEDEDSATTFANYRVKDLDNYQRNDDLGVLENEMVDRVLQDNHVRIIPVDDSRRCTKRDRTKRYIRQYKHILLIFLNHKWHELKDAGMFRNDSKICFCDEFDPDSNQWYVCRASYYNGYLTNTIYSKRIDNSGFTLDAPWNFRNKPILPFQRSSFSDHIGVSTLAVTKDDYILVFQQASYAGQSAGKLCPSGSGSMDWADFKKTDQDFKETIIRGVERELFEETKTRGKKRREELKKILDTKVLKYYRDMARGGKPEFCCITRIDKSRNEFERMISPDHSELNTQVCEFIKVNDLAKWNSIIGNRSKTSLPLIMNYRAVMEYLGRANEQSTDHKEMYLNR